MLRGMLIIMCLVAASNAGCNQLQRIKLRSQWTQAYDEALNRKAFGQDLWRRLFHISPESHALFSRVNSYDMTSPEFTAHAQRVLGGLDFCFSLLDDEAALTAALAHLWHQHKDRDVTVAQFKAFGLALREVVASAIGNCFDQGLWEDCFDLMSSGVIGTLGKDYFTSQAGIGTLQKPNLTSQSGTDTDALRNLIQFGNMVSYVLDKAFITAVLDLYDYGCYCGHGGQGQAVDAIDSCCKHHDRCYGDLIEQDICGSWGIYIQWYYYDFKDDSVRCMDKESSCARELCECDKAAALCFKENIDAYNSEHSHLSDDERCNPE